MRYRDDMDLTNDDLIEMYSLMLLTRRFEERLLQLCVEGKSFEGLHPSIGEEAVGIGACYGLREDDYVLPTLRTRGAFMARGMSLKSQMAGAFGRSTGSAKGNTDSHHSGDHDKGIIWGTGIIGAQFPVTTGIALANKLKGNDSVVICFFGDGSSFEGEFHEALNFSAVQKLPVIFVCNNNLYAASMPFSQSSQKDIADFAYGYGIPGVIVDGMDIVAVNKVVQEAVERARRGKGPSLIECKTYRFLVHYSLGKQGLRSGHIEFRPQEEIEAWKKKCPLKRLETELLEKRILTKEKTKEIENRIMGEINDAIDFAEKSPFPEGPKNIDELYAE